MSDTNANGTTRGRHTSVVDVGIPAFYIQDWVITTLYFHDYLLKTSESLVVSPDFYCLGYAWDVLLYPRGRSTEGVAGDYVSITLRLRSRTKIRVEFGFAIKGFDHYNDTSRIFEFDFLKEGGCHKIDRKTVLTHLVRGVLAVEVRMRPAGHFSVPLFIPRNPSACKTIQDLFMDEISADVVFVIGGGHIASNERKDKKLKITPKKFYAHRLILKQAAPVLVELTSMSNDSPCVIEITDITPDIFNYMLRHIYGLDIPSLDDDITTKIIRAADKYGLVNLKLEAEASYVAAISLTSENVMEHLQFAVSNNCAYLKEQAVDFVVGNKSQVLKGKILVDAPDSCLSKCDILASMARKERQSRTQDGMDDDEEYTAMCISELRREAYDKGLDIDGSREALISALESNDNDDEE